MPVGITGLSWDPAVEGLRITRARGADLTFTKSQIPSSTLTQGMQATEDWLNANLGQRVFGAGSPPPYIKTKMRTMSPFFFDYVVSDDPLDSYQWIKFPGT